VPKDLHILPKLRDSLSYLYIEKAHIERDNHSIVILRGDESREAVALRNTLDEECRNMNTGEAQDTGAVSLGVYVMMVLAG